MHVSVRASFWTGSSLILKLVSVAALITPSHANLAQSHSRADTLLSKQ